MQEKQRALEKAIRSLSMRAHSEKEIVEKLQRAGFDEKTIAEAMQSLQKYGLMDDRQFAAHWAESRARRGMGPYRIARELRDKGVDSETVSEILAQADDDAALEAAVSLAQKHLRRGDARAKERAYGALVRRGFSYDMIKKALRMAMDGSSDDDCIDFPD